LNFKKLLKSSQIDDAKVKLFNHNKKEHARRDIASEIDYSDQKSIASSMSIGGGRRRKVHQFLSSHNLG